MILIQTHKMRSKLLNSPFFVFPAGNFDRSFPTIALGEQRPGARQFALLVAELDQVQALKTIYGASILLKKEEKQKEKRTRKKIKRRTKA